MIRSHQLDQTCIKAIHFTGAPQPSLFFQLSAGACSGHVEPREWTEIGLPCEGWGTDLATAGDKGRPSFTLLFQPIDDEGNAEETRRKNPEQARSGREMFRPIQWSCRRACWSSFVWWTYQFGMFMAQGDSAVTLNGCNFFLSDHVAVPRSWYRSMASITWTRRKRLWWWHCSFQFCHRREHSWHLLTIEEAKAIEIDDAVEQEVEARESAGFFQILPSALKHMLSLLIPVEKWVLYTIDELVA